MKAKGVTQQREFFITGAKAIDEAVKARCKNPVEILSIDPSTNSTGWAYHDKKGIITFGVIKADTYGFSRLINIEKTIKEIIGDRTPFCVVEGYSFNSKFGREKAGEVGAMVRRPLWYKRRPLMEIPPQTLKSWIKAKTKDTIMLEILDKFGVKIDQNDAADAFVLQDIGYSMVLLVKDVCSKKISNPEDVRIYFKEESYKEVKGLKKMFRYQAGSLFNLIQSSGRKVDFYRKKVPVWMKKYENKDENES